MRSERLRWLVAAEGPFASVYFDDSHDTLDAVERREEAARCRKHLESRDAKQGAHRLTSKRRCGKLLDRPSASGRALIATGEQIYWSTSI